MPDEGQGYPFLQVVIVIVIVKRIFAKLPPVCSSGDSPSGGQLPGRGSRRLSRVSWLPGAGRPPGPVPRQPWILHASPTWPSPDQPASHPDIQLRHPSLPPPLPQPTFPPPAASCQTTPGPAKDGKHQRQDSECRRQVWDENFIT